jgi:hypothetical protein
VNFESINPPDYEFSIPFAFSSPVTIPVGPRSAYAGYPVFQLEGGGNYFDFVMKRISLSQIFERVNVESPYIKYTTYEWDPISNSTIETSNAFQINLLQPTALYKPTGVYPETSYAGPQTIGRSKPTGFQIVNGGSKYASDILRYSGPYEPLFRKIFKFKEDKNDTLTRNSSVDLSFRNCTFAPEQSDFGKIWAILRFLWVPISYRNLKIYHKARNIHISVKVLFSTKIFQFSCPVGIQDITIFLNLLRQKPLWLELDLCGS